MYFDIDAHRGCFNTASNEAYFWHGQTNGCGGQNNAMDIAAENSGKTLEKCMLENRGELEGAGVRFRDNDDGSVSIDFGNNMDESKRFWDDCSKAFAEQSSGNVHVIEGSDIRPNGQSERDYPSVYNRIEHPALEQNKNVNSITYINPSTGETTGCESLKHKNSGELSSSQHPDTNNNPQISGTLPNHAQGIDLPNNQADGKNGKDLADNLSKKNGSGFDANNAIS